MTSNNDYYNNNSTLVGPLQEGPDACIMTLMYKNHVYLYLGSLRVNQSMYDERASRKEEGYDKLLS
jgi:hypothetical protein